MIGGSGGAHSEAGLEAVPTAMDEVRAELFRAGESVHSVYTQYTLSIHSLYTQYTLIIHSVHSLYTQYTLSTLSIHSVYTHYTQYTVSTVSTQYSQGLRAGPLWRSFCLVCLPVCLNTYFEVHNQENQEI